MDEIVRKTGGGRLDGSAETVRGTGNFTFHGSDVPVAPYLQ